MKIDLSNINLQNIQNVNSSSNNKIDNYIILITNSLQAIYQNRNNLFQNNIDSVDEFNIYNELKNIERELAEIDIEINENAKIDEIYKQTYKSIKSFYFYLKINIEKQRVKINHGIDNSISIEHQEYIDFLKKLKSKNILTDENLIFIILHSEDISKFEEQIKRFINQINKSFKNNTDETIQKINKVLIEI